MTGELISVLVPVHNASAYLPELIASVRAQTYTNWELILVDDQSSDASWRMLEDYADQDRRVRIYRNERNLGPSATINRSAREASGSLLARLDADDRMRPTRLSEQAGFLTEHPTVGLLGSDYRTVDKGGRPTGVIKSSIRGGEALRAKFIFANAMGHSTIMFRRTEFDRVGGYDEKLRASLDYDFLARLSHDTEAAILPKALVDYRTHGSNITTRENDLQLTNAQTVQRRLLTGYGFTATDEQLSTHYRCHLHRYRKSGRTTPSLLKAGRRWLDELRRQNNQLRAFPPDAFDAVLAEVHTGLYARRNSDLRLRDYLHAFTTDFASATPGNLLIQLAHSLKNGL